MSATTIRCLHCGETNQTGDRFCGHCGKPLPTAAAPRPQSAVTMKPETLGPSPATPPVPAAQPRHYRWPMLAGVMILLLAGAGLPSFLSALRRTPAIPSPPAPLPAQLPAPPPASPDASSAARDFAEASRLFNAPAPERDLDRAFRLYRGAAEQGLLDAMDCLAAMYFNGWGTPPDLEQAIQWWLQAAERGHVNSQYNLGCAYQERKFALLDGTLTTGFDDWNRSVEWLRRAARAGHPLAQQKLREMGIKPE